jgi:hypothetical protein
MNEMIRKMARGPSGGQAKALDLEIIANYPVDEAAIGNVRSKLIDDRGGGESRGSRSTRDGNHGRRAPNKRARFSAPRDQSLDRNTRPI